MNVNTAEPKASSLWIQSVDAMLNYLDPVSGLELSVCSESIRRQSRRRWHENDLYESGAVAITSTLCAWVRIFYDTLIHLLEDFSLQANVCFSIASRESMSDMTFCGWLNTMTAFWISKADVSSVSPSLRRRANARNVNFRISLRWPIDIINPVDKTQLSRYTSHRRSTTVSLETNPSVRENAEKYSG